MEFDCRRADCRRPAPSDLSTETISTQRLTWLAARNNDRVPGKPY